MKKMSYAPLILLVLGVFVFIAVVATNPRKQPQTAPVQATEPVKKERTNADEVFRLVNVEREKAGLPPLVRDSRLDATAKLKAEEMEQTGVFAHESPGGKKGLNYLDGVIDCKPAGENLSGMSGKVSSVQTTQAWMMSTEGHKEAILDSRYDLTGIYVSENYTVQHFCNLP